MTRYMVLAAWASMVPSRSDGQQRGGDLASVGISAGGK